VGDGGHGASEGDGGQSASEGDGGQSASEGDGGHGASKGDGGWARCERRRWWVGTMRAKAASLKRAILVLVNEFKQLIVGTDAALAKLS
jgi:hypothetical protein